MIKTTNKSILLLILFNAILYFTLAAQNSYRLTGTHEEVGSTLLQEFDDGRYWIFEALPSGEPVTGDNILRITEFDECGPIQSFRFTLPGSYGINQFHNSFVEGDTVRIGMLFNAGAVGHGHAEVGMLSINIHDLGHRYRFLRADNTLHVLGFFPTQSNKYFVHAFLSYTDRPLQYCSFLLDQNFNVERYFENFGNGGVTGNAIEIEGGYFVATSRHIYKLDYLLKPVWIKRNSGESAFIRQIYRLEDGLAYRVRIPIYTPGSAVRYEYGIVKVDFEGNIIWTSENFNFDNQKRTVIKLIKNGNGNLELLVSNQRNNPSTYNNEMVIFTVDQKTGATIKRENSFNSTLVDSFKVKTYNALSNGGRQIIIEDNNQDLCVWNISDFANCNLEEGANSFPLANVAYEDLDLVPSIVDSVYTGGSQWEMLPSELEVEVICSSIAELDDFLPNEKTICIETGWETDLTAIPYSIRWNDGSTEKVRSFPQDGTYHYRVEHCDISFSESIDITLETCECDFYIPNSFSPDGNGINDHFEVFNKCEVLTNFEFSVFNRWGALIYQSSNQYDHWDGQFKGKKVNPGVYTYLLQYESVFSAKEVIESGTVSVIRSE